MRSVELIGLSGFPEVPAGADIAALIAASLESMGQSLLDADIVVVTQKIVSKSERRVRKLGDAVVTAEAEKISVACGKDPRFVALILQESREVLRVAPGVVVVEDIRGVVLANAGIDASNVPEFGSGEQVLLLPEQPDRSAAWIREGLARLTGSDSSVLIIDSIGRAWRNGTVGTAIGVSGMHALSDLRGTPDRHGRPLQTSTVGLADEIAAAASMVMGQAAEGIPVVIVRGMAVSRDRGSASELLRERQTDLFR